MTTKSTPPPGRFIAIEAPFGAASDAVAECTALTLTNGDTTRPTALCTSQPTQTPWGSVISSNYDRLIGTALALAVASDRTEQVEAQIEPYLAAGGNVICNRYLSTFMVWHQLDGVSLARTWQYNCHVRVPDLTVYLEYDPAELRERQSQTAQRTRLDALADPPREHDLFDQARKLLADNGWGPQHRLDCRGRTPAQIGATIAALINTAST